MTDIRWDRLKDLVYEALQKPPGERARFLDDACGDDLTLRGEVEELLGVDSGIEDSFLNASPFDSMVDAGLQEGEVVADRFRLVRKLGEGGMGQVWLSEQTAPVRRQVALKLIKALREEDPPNPSDLRHRHHAAGAQEHRPEAF